MLIPSPCIKTTPEPFTLKVRRPHVSVFLTFSPNKRWWRLHAFSFLGRRSRESRVALLPKGRSRQLATPLGTVTELGRSIFVECFHHVFIFIYFPLHLLSFVCPYVYIIFAMLLFFFVCLSINYIHS